MTDTHEATNALPGACGAQREAQRMERTAPRCSRVRRYLLALCCIAVTACGGGGESVPRPQANGGVLETAEDLRASGQLKGTVFGGRAKSFRLITPPLHGDVAIDAGSGSYTYTPEPDFNGEDRFSFALSDGQQLSAVAAVEIAVSAVNDAPTVTKIDDQVAEPDEASRTIQLDYGDVDGDAVTIAVVSDDPGKLGASFDPATGDLTLTPNAPGETSVTVTASDAQTQSAPQSFTVRFGGGRNSAVHTASGNADKSVLRVANLGDAPAYFALNLNDDLFFTSMDQVLESVRAAPPETADEPMHRKIWRYLYANHYHHWSLSSRVWQHDPVLFLNSIGTGMCDDLSSALYYLATHAGYNARVWSVIGHVVTELEVDGRWEVWDANMGVYYKNYDYTVAGLVDLEDNAALVSEPFAPVRPLDDDNDAYHPLVAEAYGSAEDNYVNAIYALPLNEYNRYFSLPPGAALEFPGIWDEAPEAIDARLLPVYANLKVVLPAGWTGRFSAPLVLASVKGEGAYELNGRPFEMGAEAAARFIRERVTFAHEINITRSASEVTLVYLVHPGRARLRELNHLVLEGVNVAALHSEIVPLEPARQLPFDLPIPHQPW